MGVRALQHLIGWILALLLGTNPAASAAERLRPAGLAPGRGAHGVRREEPRVPFAGENHAAPTMTISSTGELVVAAVRWQDKREQLVLRSAPAGKHEFGQLQVVADGVRCGEPRLAAGPGGAVWLAWSGRRRAPGSGDHGRTIFLRQVRPALSDPIAVSAGSGRAAHPRLAVSADGSLHLVWEQTDPEHDDQVAVVYRRVSARGQLQGPIARVSSGAFDRRPDVVAAVDGVYVAWDSLVDTTPTGRSDPDYDLFLRRLGPKGFGPVVPVDRRAGIQAAADLLSEPAGGVIVGYHSSHRHGLVKWWQLRRVREGRVEQLAADDPYAASEPQGEQQGAEFPALVRLPGGGLAVFSRPSQGAYLQLVDKRGPGPVLDLTRAGWGGRGMIAQGLVGADGTLIAVRRARREVLVEAFLLGQADAGPPRFEAVTDQPKPAPPAIERSGLRFSGRDEERIYHGDLHMHSAVSDGTGPPDEILARAWAFGLDFAALTDHDAIVGKRTFPSVQDEIAWLSDLFDRRSGFAVLQAYEWTSPPLPQGRGHYNVYFRAQRPAGWCGYRDACDDSARLSAFLESQRAIAIPHHTSWTGIRWRALPETQQRGVEIISVHGSSENGAPLPIPPRGEHAGATVVDGLRLGLRFGLVGGSDAHGLLWHHGLGRKRDPWRCGLTGVLAPGGSRAEIFDGLFYRSTFATSGTRMAAWLEAGGVAMGKAGRTAPSILLNFEVLGSGPLQGLVLVRDGKEIHRLDAGGKERLRGSWRDLAVAPGRHSYYLRAEQQGQGGPVEVVWSSPVFVNVDEARGGNSEAR